MSILSDLYRALFGKDHIQDGSVIDFSEHGRTGGVSTGQPFKFVGIVGEVTVVDESTSGTTYIGKTRLGSINDTNQAIWQIKKVLESSGITTIGYANGEQTYDKTWDNRAGYSYS